MRISGISYRWKWKFYIWVTVQRKNSNHLWPLLKRAGCIKTYSLKRWLAGKIVSLSLKEKNGVEQNSSCLKSIVTFSQLGFHFRESMGYCQEEDETPVPTIHSYQSNLGFHNTPAAPQDDSFTPRCTDTVIRAKESRASAECINEQNFVTVDFCFLWAVSHDHQDWKKSPEIFHLLRNESRICVSFTFWIEKWTFTGYYNFFETYLKILPNQKTQRSTWFRAPSHVHFPQIFLYTSW